jgi:ATP-binding cassette subfamily C protein LapB
MITLFKPKHKDNTAGMDTELSRSLITCIEPLLHAMSWSGKRNHIIEALPYMSGITSVNDFLQTMSSLHYDYTSLHINLYELNTHLVPCLFVSNTQKAYVILDSQEGKIQMYDGQQGAEVTLDNPEISGTVYIFKPFKNFEAPSKIKTSWFYSIIQPYFPMYFYALVSSFVLSILALGIPLFILAVYDQVIPSGSYSILYSYMFGMALLLSGITLLQWLQSKLLIFLGARITSKLNNSIFERILYLAPAYTEGATTSDQVARIKDFDNIKEFLIGPAFRLFFELPFVMIALVAISLLAGWIVIVPIITMCIFIVMFTLLKNTIHKNVEFSAEKSNERQEFLLEAVNHLRTIKNYHVENVWYERYLPISAEATVKNFHASVLHNNITSILEGLMTLSGFAIVALGAIKAIDGTMSTGALIATMMLVWRLLAPLKALFGSQTRLDRFLASVRQINALMAIAPERKPSILVEKIESIKGDLSFNRVTFRYPKAIDFALKGISFTVKKGEVIAVAGSTGSGKSTILKLILSLYQPQSGNILINNNQDIRQFDPIQLRYTLGYASQMNNIFFGTIAQNLLIVKPSATQEEMEHSTRRADLLDEIMALPQGFSTYLNDQSHLHFSPGFLQRLSLARTYLKKPSIILFDEPATTLDRKGEIALLNAIEYFRGHATIFLVTHRPSHLEVTDKILLLRHGELLMSGPTSQILPKLPKELL